MSTSIINGRMVTTNANSIMQINDDCYVNGKLVPKEDGTYIIGGSKVTVKNNPDGVQNFQNGNFCINIGNYKGKKKKKSKEDKDYTVSGIGNQITKNIVVMGDIHISGMNNTIIFGKENINYDTMVVKGDLNISGMSNTIKNIVQLDGEVEQSGIGNQVIR